MTRRYYRIARLAALAVLLSVVLALGAGCTRPSSGGVTVAAGIDRYTLTLSSVPGMPLTVSVAGGVGSREVEYAWTCDLGTFLTWGEDTGFVVTNRGTSYVAGQALIYWSPFLGEGEEVAKRTATLTVEVREAGTKKVVGAATVHIDCGGIWYNLRENPSRS